MKTNKITVKLTVKITQIILLSALLIGLLSACTNQRDIDENSDVDKPSESEIISEAESTSEAENTSINESLATIPQEYYQKSEKQGTLVAHNYTTFESSMYEKKGKVIHKQAIVYLPYGYSEDNQYNILYLMHGGWGNETTTLGTPNQPNNFKNVIDHAIEKGEIDPLIIVCPTYNNESQEDSADYALAFYILTVNYHNELVNDLIPSVEGTYSTYAESSSAIDIKNSRDHRAFGGFSMGSVATWYTFMNCLDEFRYFLPMSGAMDYEGDDVDAAVTASGHNPEDYLIYAITGTDDFEYRHFTNQIEGMLSMPSGNFKAIKNGSSGNVAFRVKEGYSHDGLAAMEYTYNGLLNFWH